MKSTSKVPLDPRSVRSEFRLPHGLRRTVKTSLAPLCLAALMGTLGCKPGEGGGGGDDGSGTLEAWNVINDPSILRHERDLERRFNSLMGGSSRNEITKAVPDRNMPWVDSYWPNHQGGIARRWNKREGEREAFPTYRMPTFAQVKAMSLEERAQLSPAEKFDIYMGAVDAQGELVYPLTRYEMSRNHPEAPKWLGICDGWASASVNFKEPRPFVTKSAQGVDVPFGAADLKGLLAHYTSIVSVEMGTLGRSKVVNTRCDLDASQLDSIVFNPGSVQPLAECKGVNAGSFHIILANHIGELGKPLLADLVRGREIWNYPVLGYTTKVLNRNVPRAATDAPGTERKVEVETEITHRLEIDPPLWRELKKENDIANTKARYRYVLELNRKGEIIGGEWISKERPEFLWTQSTPEFRGYFRRLGILYRESRNAPDMKDMSAL